ncbi:hypothetical protein NQ315_017077 [Exocentrus adspersus]|uniref:Proteasome inhibitor PI31 subunit n=1 Tax=Exocentrus adspersus TaxID=1586481 RepID=A0AAV8VI21_9CUCU|nr:hypothetical protein NQ315_017077 [Exocentrus adspersus]
MPSTDLFGWDLLYSSVEDDIKNDQDILVCLAHLVLVSNGFKCVGSGTSRIIDGAEGREPLPKGWNEDYAIRYVYLGRLYIFKATSLDNGLMLNLQSADENTVSLVQLKTRTVTKKHGALEDMIPEYKSIVDTIKKQLFEKVVGYRKFKESSSQTEDAETETSLDIFKSISSLGRSDVKILYRDFKSQLKVQI